jgi:hypothetical protein
MPYLVHSEIMVDLTREIGAAADYLGGLAGVWPISTITCLELDSPSACGWPKIARHPEAIEDALLGERLRWRDVAGGDDANHLTCLS